MNGTSDGTSVRDARFEHFRAGFMLSFKQELIEALGASVDLSEAPVAVEVQRRFMDAMDLLGHDTPVDVAPTLHGTRAPLDSILQHGLLIPGKGNTLRVVNGSAHGLGIYTANLNAAWLSLGFSHNSQLLVCAVLQTPSVRHVMDAQVIFDESHVIPLFLASRVVQLGRFCGAKKRCPHPISSKSLLLSIAAQEGNHSREAIILAGYFAADLIQAGYTLSELKTAGCSARRLKSGGIPISHLKDCGYAAEELRQCFTVMELLDVGFSRDEVIKADFEAAHLVQHGFTLLELCNGGFPASNLRHVFSIRDLQQAGYTLQDLAVAGFSPSAWAETDVTLKDLLLAGYSLFDARRQGAETREIMKLGLPEAVTILVCGGCDGLKATGKDVIDLINCAKHIGISLYDLHQSGCPLTSLVEAGYGLTEIRSAGVALLDLPGAGLTATHFKKLGCRAEELKKSGCTVAALKQAGFKYDALKAAGFPVPALKRVFKR